ncbi:MAG: heme lyase CcmF/NrfE family subunit [Alphaproteobacteria bacterium]|nr:heme lyase CcmF/NrfE family subunit [Alphaproteobacteria bacterium]MBV9694593.1 heme lyase CcmF/NrfE family subunit [Alphaproteobacteria bacterium]
MTGEIGQLALCLALALALVQAGAGVMGLRQPQAAQIAAGAASGGFVFVALAFAALVYGFVTSDFSIADVAHNSHTAKPLLYKITGVWGNHEGSMLLWVLVLSVYSAAIAFMQRGGARLTSAALGVQGLLAIAFLLFILLTSNPFARLDPMPFEGAGLNPLLQDPGLAFHPPTLYTGYVGLSATFAYAAAALITGDVDRAWARAARPFILIAWIALTLGIAGGSWWAYYDLGWGGFWFWDPVENASLMPWLVATALLHSALATERTGAFRTWTLLLSIMAFSLSLIGTFLVRSGVIVSVHAFASDPTRGNVILLILSAAILGALALFAWRAPRLESGAAFAPASRETALLINNILLVTALAVVFVGTVYPIALSAFDVRLSVGAPYFEKFFAPLFVALMIVLPFGPRLAWQRGELKLAARQLLPALAAAVFAAVIVVVAVRPRTIFGAGAFAVAAWTIAASFVDAALRARARTLGVAAMSAILAHAGLGVTLMGISGTTLWRLESLQVLAPGETMTIGRYDLRFDGVRLVQGPNYRAAHADLDVMRDRSVIGHLAPERRLFPAEGQETVQTAIRTTGLEDLYVALGDDRGGGSWTVRAYVNPLAPLIWLGAAIMALGGAAALGARLRARLWVPARAPAPEHA